MMIKSSLKSVLPSILIEAIRASRENIYKASITSALKEQKLDLIYSSLCNWVPDITDHYSTFRVNTEFLHAKVRGQHAFQIAMLQKTFEYLNIADPVDMTIVDIGDSAGTHLQYLHEIYPKVRSLSVNMDKNAVHKIRAKGMEAIHCRAQDLQKQNIHADIYISFEMLEHLSDPIDFLHSLSGTRCRALVVTVPFLRVSRVGLYHIRFLREEEIFAENTHYFELCPSDWKLIFQHAGWIVAFDQIYYQYPQIGLFRLLKSTWKKNDFEGFYGAILVRNDRWSKCYRDW